ncbi:hypothetical protein NV226_02840 [Mycoplasma iguanae]|uniref:DUF1292 domain-containing protein n=1 Tax=Mycoplasma iguanae TaxID=292461 RepID=A0ABY5RA48_9MOLU|nr:hypothetical protein [Mycoplasma iguanae]UVD81637.1 hypothetical protein NV226_02840 [Mycoplasma iguanae]
MVNLKDKDREIELQTTDGKKIIGHILFHYEDSGYKFVYYVVEDVIYVQKENEIGKLEDLLDDEYEIAEKILEAFLEENEVIDENDNSEIRLKKQDE